MHQCTIHEDKNESVNSNNFPTSLLAAAAENIRTLVRNDNTRIEKAIEFVVRSIFLYHGGQFKKDYSVWLHKTSDKREDQDIQLTSEEILFKEQVTDYLAHSEIRSLVESRFKDPSQFHVGCPKHKKDCRTWLYKKRKQNELCPYYVEWKKVLDEMKRVRIEQTNETEHKVSFNIDAMNEEKEVQLTTKTTMYNISQLSRKRSCADTDPDDFEALQLSKRRSIELNSSTRNFYRVDIAETDSIPEIIEPTFPLCVSARGSISALPTSFSELERVDSNPFLRRYHSDSDLSLNQIVPVIQINGIPISSFDNPLADLPDNFAHLTRCGGGSTASDPEDDPQDSNSYTLVTDPKEVTKQTDSGKRALIANVREDMLLQRRYDQFQREFTNHLLTVKHAQRPFRKHLDTISTRQRQIHNERLRLLETLEGGSETREAGKRVGNGGGRSSGRESRRLKELIHTQVKTFNKNKNTEISDEERLFIRRRIASVRAREALERQQFAERRARFLAESKEDLTIYQPFGIQPDAVLGQERRYSEASQASVLSLAPRPNSAPINETDGLLEASLLSHCCSPVHTRPATAAGVSTLTQRSDLDSFRPFFCKSPIHKAPTAIFKDRQSPKFYMCRSARKSSPVAKS